MILLDYIYYQLTNLYRYFNKDGIEKAYGIIMTCGLCWWNLIFLIIILDYYFNINVGPSNKYILLLYGLPIVLLICLRYWKFTSYKEIKEKIQGFSKTKQTIADVLLIIYITTSILGMIGFAVYIGITKH